MRCRYSCGSSEHLLARRGFLGKSAAAVGSVFAGLNWLSSSSATAALSSDQKRVLVVNMSGGLSQLESWDPKPGTRTGGPFRAIPTAVPGMQISELLPHTAKVMQHLSIVRSVNTKENDHGKGRYAIMTGRRQTPAADYPKLGAVSARTLSPSGLTLPGHIQITPGGSGGRSNDSAYLGPQYAGVVLGNGEPPKNTKLPGSVDGAGEKRRQMVRQQVDERFLSRRRTAFTDAYTYSYEQARQLMQQRDVFDVTKEPEKDHQRYGQHDFGRHCLLARRLLDSGITFVQVSHTNYDTHNENFNFHLEQLGEFDRTFANLVTDIVDRGMLDSTLIVVLSEFGRTPTINSKFGRDHWGKAWSVLLGGAGIQPGAIIGSTNAEGTAVADREVDHSHLFHTYLQAVGVDSESTIDVDGRPMPLADPASEPIRELLV